MIIIVETAVDLFICLEYYQSLSVLSCIVVVYG
jgi:hypothetical protein